MVFERVFKLSEKIERRLAALQASGMTFDPAELVAMHGLVMAYSRLSFALGCLVGGLAAGGTVVLLTLIID